MNAAQHYRHRHCTVLTCVVQHSLSDTTLANNEGGQWTFSSGGVRLKNDGSHRPWCKTFSQKKVEVCGGSSIFYPIHPLFHTSANNHSNDISLFETKQSIVRLIIGSLTNIFRCNLVPLSYWSQLIQTGRTQNQINYFTIGWTNVLLFVQLLLHIPYFKYCNLNNYPRLNGWIYNYLLS